MSPHGAIRPSSTCQTSTWDTSWQRNPNRALCVGVRRFLSFTTSRRAQCLVSTRPTTGQPRCSATNATSGGMPRCVEVRPITAGTVARHDARGAGRHPAPHPRGASGRARAARPRALRPAHVAAVHGPHAPGPAAAPLRAGGRRQAAARVLQRPATAREERERLPRPSLRAASSARDDAQLQHLWRPPLAQGQPQGTGSRARRGHRDVGHHQRVAHARGRGAAGGWRGRSADGVWGGLPGCRHTRRHARRVGAD